MSYVSFARWHDRCRNAVDAWMSWTCRCHGRVDAMDAWMPWVTVMLLDDVERILVFQGSCGDDLPGSNGVVRICPGRRIQNADRNLQGLQI